MQMCEMIDCNVLGSGIVGFGSPSMKTLNQLSIVNGWWGFYWMGEDFKSVKSNEKRFNCTLYPVKKKGLLLQHPLPADPY